jgi:hypothetical protein
MEANSLRISGEGTSSRLKRLLTDSGEAAEEEGDSWVCIVAFFSEISERKVAATEN